MYVIRMEGPQGKGIYQTNGLSTPPWRYCTNGINNQNHPLPGNDDTLVEDSKDFRKRNHVLELVDDFNKDKFENGHLLNAAWGYNMLFGFKDRAQFLKWCYDPVWRETFVNNDCWLAVYEVDDDYTIIGDTQMLFIEEKAKKVDTLPFDYFDYNEDY